MSAKALTELMDKVAPKLATQGARSSLLHSDDIPGYDPNHVESLKRTYLASVYGKRNAEFQRAADAGRKQMVDNGKGQLARYTDTYTDVQLDPNSKAANAIRAWTFFATSAMKPATLIGNLVQPLQNHAPELIDLGAGANVYLKTAASMMNNATAIPRAGFDAIMAAKDGASMAKAWEQFSPTEAMIRSYTKRNPEFGGILRTMADRGEMGTSAIEVFNERGTVSDRVLGKMGKFMSAMFGESERINRMAAAKTAFDLYSEHKNDVAWWDRAKGRNYRGATEGPNAGRDFVEWAVSRSNFEYGKANRPLLASGKIGGTSVNLPAAGAMGYALRHYQVSQLGTVLRIGGNAFKDKQSAKAAFAMFAGMLAAGGAAGMPFVQQGYNWTKDIVNAAGGFDLKGFNEQLAQANDSIKGYVGQAGADILTRGAGKAVDSPVLESLGQRTGQQNIIPTAGSLEQAAGIPVSAVVKLGGDVRNLYNEATAGGQDKKTNLGVGQALANVVSSTTGLPASDINRALTQAKTGDVTDRYGNVVHGAKIGATATAMGFTDPMTPVMQEARDEKKNVEEAKLNTKAGIVRDFTEAIRTGDRALAKGAVERLMASNKAAVAAKKPENLMTSQELRMAILYNYSNLTGGPLSIKAIKGAKPQDRPRLIQLRRWVEGEIQSREPQNEETPAE